MYSYIMLHLCSFFFFYDVPELTDIYRVILQTSIFLYPAAIHIIEYSLYTLLFHSSPSLYVSPLSRF